MIERESDRRGGGRGGRGPRAPRAPQPAAGPVGPAHRLDGVARAADDPRGRASPLPGLERAGDRSSARTCGRRAGASTRSGARWRCGKRTRFFPVGLQFGVNTEKEITGARVTGPELRLQLPIFDTGKASRRAPARREHRRAQRQLEALAVDARSEVREQQRPPAGRRASWRCYHREELLPQRRAHPRADAPALQRDVQGRLRPAAGEGGRGRRGAGDSSTPGATTGSRAPGWSAPWAARSRPSPRRRRANR